MDNLVDIKNLKKGYGNKVILNNVDFSIKNGEMVTITGKSGCGKSTFLNMVGLLDKPDSGEYLFAGKSVTKGIGRMERIRGEEIGFIFQSYCLLDNLSVMDNILMPFCYNDTRINTTLKKKIDEYLEKFDLKELSKHKAKYLSGGEKQRVSVVRALAKEPSLIVADEPTGNLDLENSKIIFDELKKISRMGKAVIVVTHNEEIFRNVDKKYCLRNGELKNE